MDENETWVAAVHERPPKTNAGELVAVALSAHPLRERIVELLDDQGAKIDVRVMTPEPGLDPEDLTIPEDRFAFRWQFFIDHEGEFISVATVPLEALGRYVDESPAG